MYIIWFNIFPSLKILNATLSYCICNVMHKSTLITYFIKSKMIKKNDQKISLCSTIISVPVSVFSTKPCTCIAK